MKLLKIVAGFTLISAPIAALFGAATLSWGVFFSVLIGVVCSLLCGVVGANLLSFSEED